MTKPILGGDYLLVNEIPKGAKNIEVKELLEFDDVLEFTLNGILHRIPLPIGDWKIVGKVKDIGEDVWNEIIPGRCRFNGTVLKGEPNEWNNYENPLASDSRKAFTTTATESGLSLVKSEGFDENDLLLKKENV
jgi:hypothetical protein